MNVGRSLVVAALAVLAHLADVRAQAQVPEARAIAEVTIRATGRPIGLSHANDGSIYILVESPEDGPTAGFRPHLLKVDRGGTVSAPIDIPRLSCPDDNQPLAYGTGYRHYRAPLSVLPSGEMLAVATGGLCGVVGRFDANGKLLQTKQLRWGTPLRFRGDVRIIEKSPDGSFVLSAGIVAAENDAWVVKVDAGGTVSWSARLGVGELLAYRSAADGSGQALYGESSSNGRYALSLIGLKETGTEERRIRLMQCQGCRSTTGALLGSTAIYAPAKPSKFATSGIEVFDRAGKRADIRRWQLGGEIVSLEVSGDRMIGLSTATDPLDTDGRIMSGIDATGTVRWRSPTMRIVDLAVSNDDIAVLVSGNDPATDDWRLLRYASP